ncbi:MAG: hypothetical protein M3P12_05975 [Gemmatimonadota bacterium]|nr:hypothetical protein [Gemmatimonadota bacterium]
MRRTLRRPGSLLLIGLPALLLACSETEVPPPNPILGTYSATSFTTTGSSGQRNEILAGSTLVLTLKDDGTTSGHLHIAASGTNTAFDADMAGTWSQNGTLVEFSQAADTFVKDMIFTWGPDSNGILSLSGDQVFSGARVQIVLTKAS